MTRERTIQPMPRGTGKKQVSFTASEQRKADYEEAAKRLHLDNLSSFLKIAAEEKLQRDFPDIYKRG